MSQENRTERFEYLLTECDDGHAQAKVDKELFGFLYGSLLDEWPNISLKLNYGNGDGDNYLIINHPENPNFSLYIDVDSGQSHVQYRVSENNNRGYRWTSQKVFSDARNIKPLLQEIGTFLSDAPKSR